MRPLFLAYVIAGPLLALVARALAVPFTRSEVFAMISDTSGLTPLIHVPPWPDHLVIPPGIPLGAVWWLAAILIAGGALGLTALAQPSRLPLAGALLLAWSILTAGLVSLLARPWFPEDGAAQLAGLDLGNASHYTIVLGGREWPDDRVLFRVITVGWFYGVCAITGITGAVAVIFSKQLVTARGNALLAILTFVLAAGIGTATATLGPDLASFVAACPLVCGIAGLLVAAVAVPLWLRQRRRTAPTV